MLGTGASLNSGEVGVTVAEEHIATGPEISNIPLSPEVQSRLPSRSDLERDGYDSDASVNPYAEVADEGPLEVDEPPLQEVGNGNRIPSTTPGAEPPRDAKDSGSARSHSTHLETSSSNRP